MTLKEFDKYRGRYVLLGGFKLPIVGYDVNATQLKLKSFRLESEKFLEDALAYN